MQLKILALFWVYKKCMIMANVERKKWNLEEEIIKFMSKISLINSNVLKSIMITKNLPVNSKTELTITLTRFFLVTSSFAKTKIWKNWIYRKIGKKLNKIETLNTQKSPNHPLIFFLLYLKKVEKLKLKTRSQIFSSQTWLIDSNTCL